MATSADAFTLALVSSYAKAFHGQSVLPGLMSPRLMATKLSHYHLCCCCIFCCHPTVFSFKFSAQSSAAHQLSAIYAKKLSCKCLFHSMCVCPREKSQVRDQFNLMEFVIDLRKKIESHKINKGQRRGEEGHRSVKGESEMPLKAS